MIKPIVGVTLVSSGNRTNDGAGGFAGDEFNFGTAVQTTSIGLQDASALPHPAPGSEALHGQSLGACIGGSSMQDPSFTGSTTAIPVTMTNIGASDSTTAGMGAGAFGQSHQHLQQHLQQHQSLQNQQQQHMHDLEKGHEPQELEYPHDLLHQQQQKLMQDQAKMQQMQQQIEAQQKIIQQQQLQIQQQQKAYNFHPDLVIAAPVARAPPTTTNNPAGTLAGGSGSKSSLLSGHSVAGSIGQGGSKDKRPSIIESEILGTASTAASALNQHNNRRKSTTVKPQARGLHVDIPLTSSTSVPQTGGLPPNTANTLGGMKLPPAAVALATSPIIMMDESLLGGGRHSQRFKDALQVAQEASRQKMVEVQSPTASTGGVMVIPAQVQLPMGATSTGSTTKKSGSSNNVPTLKKISSPAAATTSSAATTANVEAPPKANNNAGPLVASYSSRLPDVTATLPGPQQPSQPHHQRIQRPPAHPFASQKSQGSVSGHGHLSPPFTSSTSTDPSFTSGGEGPSSALISASSAVPFVLNLPTRVVVPITTSTTSPTSPPSS